MKFFVLLNFLFVTIQISYQTFFTTFTLYDTKVNTNGFKTAASFTGLITELSTTAKFNCLKLCSRNSTCLSIYIQKISSNKYECQLYSKKPTLDTDLISNYINYSMQYFYIDKKCILFIL